MTSAHPEADADVGSANATPPSGELPVRSMVNAELIIEVGVALALGLVVAVFLRHRIREMSGKK